MTLRASRPMEYAKRFGVQQADQAIKRDVVRAVIELITNSDDSYRRLEERGQEADGRIIIELQRRRPNSIIRVIDLAEGMDDDTLDRALGRYAEDMSGFSSGVPVRGYFGRGIKDAMLGLGKGTVTSIKRGQMHRARLEVKDGEPYYDAQRAVKAPESFLGQPFNGDSANATVVELTILRDNVKIPFFENLKRQISLSFPLRDILTSPKRDVRLRELDPRGRQIRQEFQLRYEFPVGQLLENATLSISEFNTVCEVSLHRAEVDLETPREAAYLAEAGLLIKGESTIYDNTLFKFESNVHANRFFGSAYCPYLDELLSNDEPFLRATRDGLDSGHPFVKELFRVCEEFLEPFVEEEARRARIEEHRTQNPQLRQKLSNVLTRLNRIAREELTVLDTGGSDEEVNPVVPDSGFGFVPDMANLILAKRKTLLVRTHIPQIIPEGASVTISSDNPNVAVMTPMVVIEPKEDFPWVGEAKVIVEGHQAGAEAFLEAECEGLTAEGFVRVIVRDEPTRNGDVERQRRSGLFNETRFSDDENPRQRVRYDRETHDIIIAIKHPSVSPYITDVAGAGTETPSGQVMLAELISEAVCSTIARRGVDTGRFPSVPGSESDAIQVHQLRLQNQYSGVIHQAIVEPQHRNV